jgi:hypothetical protein
LWPNQNGNDLLGLARNLGEVYGVFAVFQPIQSALYTDYLHNNSANFNGLGKLEDLIKLIGPPQWPWQVDANLAAQGQAIYNHPGSCTGCHGIKPVGQKTQSGKGPLCGRTNCHRTTTQFISA